MTAWRPPSRRKARSASLAGRRRPSREATVSRELGSSHLARHMKNRAIVHHGWRAGRAPSPARVFLWISAVYLLVLGLGSLVVSPTFAVGDEVSGDHLFGVIDTNGWHGLAGVLLGASSLAFAMSGRWAREGAAVMGASLLASGVVLLLYGEGSVAPGPIPVDARDAVLPPV